MVLSAFLLVLLGAAVTAAGARATFSALGLDARETLLWFGLAEHPAPPVSRRPRERRPRPAPTRRTQAAPVRRRSASPVAARRPRRCA